VSEARDSLEHAPDLNSGGHMDAYAAGWDEGQEAIWNEPVCSRCGDNHDRDESAMCDGAMVISFREWVREHRRGGVA
jgi:hypothetical protein